MGVTIISKSARITSIELLLPIALFSNARNRNALLEVGRCRWKRMGGKGKIWVTRTIGSETTFR